MQNYIFSLNWHKVKQPAQTDTYGTTETVHSTSDIHYNILHHGLFNAPFAMYHARFVRTPVRLSVCPCYSRQCGPLTNCIIFFAFFCWRLSMTALPEHHHKSIGLSDYYPRHRFSMENWCPSIHLSVCPCHSRQCGLLPNYLMLVAFLFTSFDHSIIPLAEHRRHSIGLSVYHPRHRLRLFVSLYRPRPPFIIMVFRPEARCCLVCLVCLSTCTCIFMSKYSRACTIYFIYVDFIFILCVAWWVSGRALDLRFIGRGVQFPPDPLSRNIGQLSLASLQGR